MLEILYVSSVTKILKIVICIIVSYSIYGAIKILMSKQNTKHMKKRKQTIRKLIQNIIKYAIIILALLTILSILGINVTSILAGLGIAGVVLGLALQDIMKDILSGISIVLEDQFDVGDYVEINGIKGTVTELSLKSTKIKTYENVLHIISNRTIDKVTNYSKTNINLTINIPLPYEVELKEATRITKKIKDKISKQIKEVKGEITIWGLNEFKDSSIYYTLLVPVPANDRFECQRRINEIIKEELEKENLSIPYNIIEVKNG